MKPATVGLALSVACAAGLQGQSPAPGKSFDVADVHPAAATAVPIGVRNGVLRDGIYRVRQATMVDLIRLGYGVDADKVIGGPHWLELDRYDLAAKVPAGTTREGVRPMLQSLLAERFRLVVRQEPKLFPGQALVVSGTPKLKEAAGGAPAGCQQSVSPPSPGQGSLMLVMSCKATTMAAFAERLTSLAGSGPVLDATALAGAWDLEFRFSPTPGFNSSMLTAAALSDILDKSLGLKLEARAHSLPTVFVERVERTPTPNSPAVATAFPSGPEPEFEVAEIRPSTATQQSRRILPTGQLTITGATMQSLVSFAWLIPDEAQISGPKSLDGPRYDLIAKISSRPIDPSELDPDDLSLMMRKLLVDGFTSRSAARIRRSRRRRSWPRARIG